MNLGFKADILLNNATVIALNPYSSILGFVALKGNRILAIGRLDEAKNFKSAYTKEIDCQTQCLIPGFTDSHCHLLALASSMRNINFQTEHIYSIAELVNIISRACETKQPGEWIRANGYDEFNFKDNRHPTRWDLDMASEDHPIRLDHRTGHASVLNTKALHLLGINKYTPDPLDGIIARDDSGEPTGLVLEMANELRKRMPAERNHVDYLTGIKMANRLLLSKGITAIQDAGIENDITRWNAFENLIEQGHIVPKISIMIGGRHFDQFMESGIIHDKYRKLSLGPVKLGIGLTTGSMQPDQKTLNEIVFRMHAKNFQVAIHAIERDAVKSALFAIIEAQSKLPNQNIRHRIEHCSECPPQLLGLFKRSGAVAVTHPAFIYHTGDKYIAQIDNDILSEIYPIASLLRSGITVASSSDSPVTYPDPFLDIYTAITRNTSSGASINISERLSVESALELWTTKPAYVSHKENVTGNIMPGMLADLVLINRNPFQVETETIKDIKVAMTIVDGNIEWES